jgi:hypothetical protein
MRLGILNSKHDCEFWFEYLKVGNKKLNKKRKKETTLGLFTVPSTHYPAHRPTLAPPRDPPFLNRPTRATPPHFTDAWGLGVSLYIRADVWVPPLPGGSCMSGHHHRPHTESRGVRVVAELTVVGRANRPHISQLCPVLSLASPGNLPPLQGWFGDPGSREDWRGLREKLVYFPLDPLQSSRDPLVTKSTLIVSSGYLSRTGGRLPFPARRHVTTGGGIVNAPPLCPRGQAWVRP